ncbi:hypothetical protein MGG_06674 [Pyricularia oryzae 70-15]|uniref:Phosphatidylinositol N-acetylglucosaminyltransferase subunit H conserved domain-containing protein n=1 Tax=Pyricularia oryzae (strain 70-15 / ATCC MYA-4617 / FGSC 8958) TaxID=242507 RepID=G4MKS8_PYRO7|nr:uncharacterized protein MGG_06674 [Pyricularia oryzae 70-15]EHA56768.1 hypothetical protein MGG_06674 [Pyricularia oryzae 70-15]
MPVHLDRRSSSSTTAEFTVTTRPPLTLGLRVLLAAVTLGRIIIAASAVLLLYAKWDETFPKSPQQSSFHRQENDPLGASPLLSPEGLVELAVHLLRLSLASPPGRVFASLSTASPAYVLVPLCLALLHVSQLRIYRSETLLVLRGLGVQTISQGDGFILPTLGGPKNRFIPTEKIRDVVINEAPLGFEVRFYLVIIVEGEEELVVVFPRLLPRRPVVEAVWRGVRACLHEPESVEQSK